MSIPGCTLVAMQFDPEGFKWVLSDRALTPEHPDYDYWREAAEELEWIEAGAPSEEVAAPEPAPEPERVPVHLQLTVTKEQAGQLLGGKSVDWIEKHVLPNVPTLRPSRSVLIPTAALEKWVNENTSFALEK